MNNPKLYKQLLIIAPLLIVLSFCATSFSLPRFAIKYATDCQTCHINPTGGGMRNEFGNHSMAFNELVLPQTKKYVKDKYKSPRLGEGVTYGFDSRYLVLPGMRVFRMQTDAYLALEPFDGLTYQIRFWEFGVNEHFALLSTSNERYFIKAGRFYPAFGLRNADHKAFNRERTGHGSNVYLDGISIGGKVGKGTVVFEMFNPNQRGVYGIHGFRTGQFKKIGYMVGASLRLSENYTYLDGNGPFPHAKAIFGGLNYDRFTLEGELDIAGLSNDTLIVYANFTTRIEYGLYFIAEYNFFDGDRDLLTGVDEQIRLSIELFPLPYIELRPSYTINTRGALDGENSFFLQIHVGY